MRTIVSFVIGALLILACAPLASAKVGGGDVEYKPKGAGKVLFQHEVHVNLKGMRCNNCHYRPFAMATGSQYKMDMSKLTKGEFCGSCHNGKNAFDLKAPNCNKCHKD
jgi:c(7)-type cytochrome triheme protein